MCTSYLDIEEFFSWFQLLANQHVFVKSVLPTSVWQCDRAANLATSLNLASFQPPTGFFCLFVCFSLKQLATSPATFPAFIGDFEDQRESTCRSSAVDPAVGANLMPNPRQLRLAKPLH